MNESYNPAKDEKKLRQIVSVGHDPDMPSRWIRCLAGEILNQNTRIASLEKQLQEREDERNKALRLLWNCSAKLESQVMRHPNLPKSYYTTMKEGFDYIREINASPPITKDSNQ